VKKEFLDLLKEDPEFKEEVRRIILPEELMRASAVPVNLKESFSSLRHIMEVFREDMIELRNTMQTFKNEMIEFKQGMEALRDGTVEFKRKADGELGNLQGSDYEVRVRERIFTVLATEKAFEHLKNGDVIQDVVKHISRHFGR